MDPHDKQFESFLRQFRLRMPNPLPEIAADNRRSSFRWALAAAGIVIAIALSTVFLRDTGKGGSPSATVEAAGNPSLYRVGETIGAGRAIRSNSAEGLVLALEDGSRVEMRSQSEFHLEPADDGIRVRLNDGSILVTAATQRKGHLYVQTRDALVSVVGTVFLVRAERSGTRVAVVEGEVHVQDGAALKTLLRGEQVTTNPSIQLKTVAEEISWSRSSSEYVALLPQPVPFPVLPPLPEIVPQQEPSAPKLTQADPVGGNRGKQIFEKECTSCHNAEVALKLVSIAPQFTPSDREKLSSRQAELAKLLQQGFAAPHPDVVRVQAEVKALLAKESKILNNYSSFVFRHLKDGGGISGPEFPILIRYLFYGVYLPNNYKLN